MCIQCEDVQLTFEEPPAGAAVLYTVNGTEPSIDGDPHTHRYTAGGVIAITRGEYHQVIITARLFAPHGGSNVATLLGDSVHQGHVSAGALSYRYGHLFSRGFFFKG
jgi:hypothetical protein